MANTKKRKRTTEEAIEGMLCRVLGERVSRIEECISFGEVGVMTTNRGVVLRLEDGTQFQLSIHQDRNWRR